MSRRVYNRRFVNNFIRHYLKYDKDNPFIFISAILAFGWDNYGGYGLMISMGVMDGDT